MTTKKEHRIDVRRLRERAGLTQRQVSVALDVAPNTVATWEHKGRQPHVRYLPDMAKLFGCTIEELYGLPRP